MPCYHPIQGWRGRKKNPATGKYPIVFKPQLGYEDLPQNVSCGRCIGCTLKRSRAWAIRCVHEASLYERNCFITLTYDDEHLPSYGSLVMRHFQLFMKSLRKEFGSGIRYFHCGEYGAKFGRPHYHALLFNFDFDDKIPLKGDLFISDTLSRLWGKGYATVGSVSYESAAYVSRYVTKKTFGDRGSLDHRALKESNRVPGVLYDPKGRPLKPEYITMSRRPGLGKGWLDKYTSDVYPDDFVVINGSKFNPPRYYDKNFELDNPDVFAKIVKSRMIKAKQNAGDSTPERLEVRERVSIKMIQSSKREYENAT